MKQRGANALRVSSERLNDWGLIDKTFCLRLRAFRDLCLQPVFDRLEREYRLSDMRRRGITQVMYFLDFEQRDVPLAVGTPLRMRHEVRMHNSSGWARGGGKERLLWGLNCRIDGHRHASSVSSLGAGNNTSLVQGVGAARSIHILTRPTAPLGERAVTEVPPELRGFRVHPWLDRMPDAASLSEVPEGYGPAKTVFTQEYRDIWGVGNTDANQHVNVLEYIIGVENQTTRHVAAAQMDVAAHRLRRLRILFRRPFFAAERYCLTTRLYLCGDQSYFLAEYRPTSGANRVASRSAVIAVAEGGFQGLEE